MADNVTLGPESGRAVIAHDDISSVQHQRVKVQHGADGSATDVSNASPLPSVAKLATDEIWDGTTALTPKYATFDGVAGDIELVAAVTDKKIRLLAVCITFDAADGTIRFESAAGGTALSGLMEVANDDPLILSFNPVGWLETAASAALSLEAVTTGAAGMAVYVEV